MRLKLTIAYDGRPYAGWQIQPHSDTVQEHIEQAIATVCKSPSAGQEGHIRLHGSGRTDTGVHAQGQVAHFDAPDSLTMNPYNWLPALNSKLPPTIRIMDCTEVPPDFHSRYHATSKTYTYALSIAPILPPLRAGLTWHLPRQLNPQSLEEALQLFIGTHDFRAFAANRGNETPDTDYTRTITQADLTPTDEGYLITYTGNGFLYKMVRLLTGAALQVAQGRLFFLEDLQTLLNQPSGREHAGQGLAGREHAGQDSHQKSPLCAPPDGLTLHSVSYQNPTLY